RAAEAPAFFRTFAAGLCQALLPDGVGRSLGLPETRWRHVVDALPLILGPGEAVRRASPRWIEDRLVAFGKAYWKAASERVPRDAKEDFTPPASLDGTAAS
ncbi:MAG: hypothetical protein AAF211_10085, partial [Myxococcota bacterium]